MAEEAAEEEIVDCACCTLQIHRSIHIKCGECPANLCLQCFRMGAEVGSHKRGHNYELVDTVGQPTFNVRGCWGSLEESKLLTAAHRFKMGNWGEMVNLMKSDRNASHASDYYDKYFIRGPIGQFGLKGAEWRSKRREIILAGSLSELVKDKENPFRYHLMLEALRWKEDENLDWRDDDLEEDITRITNDYVDAILAGEVEQLDLDSPSPMVLSSQVPDYDSFDPTSDDESRPPPSKKKKRSPNRHKGDYATGQISDDDDVDLELPDSIPILVLKKVPLQFVKIDKDKNGRYQIAAEIRNKITAEMNGITKKANGQKEKRKRTRKDCISSSDEEDEKASDSDTPYTNGHCNGNGISNGNGYSNGKSNGYYIHEENGFEKEQSETSSDEDEQMTPPNNNNNNKISALKKQNGKDVTMSTKSKRKRKKMKSKKQRRLEYFERRVVRRTKHREAALDEIEEICPMKEIKELRAEQPKLCMDKPRNTADRPKLRVDDLTMLGYNVDRDEFEIESFNEVETLISRLLINLPQVNNKTSQVENNIKFSRIQKYNRALSLRNARKRAVIEHDKITEFFNFQMALTVEKRKASEILNDRPEMDKILTRCQQTLTKEELSKLTDHLERADHLKARITKLRELQTKGVTSLKGFEKEFGSTNKKKDTTKCKGIKLRGDDKKKAGLRWKAIQRWHKSQLATTE